MSGQPLQAARHSQVSAEVLAPGARCGSKPVRVAPATAVLSRGGRTIEVVANRDDKV